MAASAVRQHNFLVLSQDTGTIVLQTDGDLQEVTESGFNMGSPTVLVANILDDSLVVQVTPFEVRLLWGTVPLQQVPYGKTPLRMVHSCVRGQCQCQN